ncbi:hypothetical protein Tco_0217700 [Tanacetum coccineum]
MRVPLGLFDKELLSVWSEIRLKAWTQLRNGISTRRDLRSVRCEIDSRSRYGRELCRTSDAQNANVLLTHEGSVCSASLSIVSALEDVSMNGDRCDDKAVLCGGVMQDSRRSERGSYLSRESYTFDLVNDFGSFMQHAIKINDDEVHNKLCPCELLRGCRLVELLGSFSADSCISIEVFALVTKPNQNGKTECCDVVEITEGMDIAKIKLRDCMDDELIA